MVGQWTQAQIHSILSQLERRKLPFSQYTLERKKGGPVRLGSGSYASVYGLTRRRGLWGKAALKVIGFEGKTVSDFKKTLSMQQRMATECPNVVKIYDFLELRVWMDEDGNILRTEKDPTGPCQIGDFLDLQFIAMERLEPVLAQRADRPQLTPEALNQGAEPEMLRLGVQIAQALQTAHGFGVLHRDVKLENIFYDSRHRRYKLGDFGVAKPTKDGFASTVALTKGYGAPEVVSAAGERYDGTADIYSFGILLYLLMNDLCFPDSEGYHLNASRQYCSGYVPPRPKRGQDELWAIVKKCCAFDPDERPQSMEAVAFALDRIDETPLQRYQAETGETPYVLMTVFLMAFLTGIRFTYSPGTVYFDWLEPILAFLGLLIWWQRRSGKKLALLRTALVLLGLWWIAKDETALWQCCLVGFYFGGGSMTPALSALGIWDAVIAYASAHYPEGQTFFEENLWILSVTGMLTITFAAFSIQKYSRWKKQYNYLYRIGVEWAYLICPACLICFEWIDRCWARPFWPKLEAMGMPGVRETEKLVECFLDMGRPFHLGLTGCICFAVSLGWILRERYFARKLQQRMLAPQKNEFKVE